MKLYKVMVEFEKMMLEVLNMAQLNGFDPPPVTSEPIMMAIVDE